MFISSMIVRNFRCFERIQLSFDAPIVLIEGANGSGKTSLIEALSFACHMRSFRTHIPRELIHFGAEGSSIQVGGTSFEAEPWEIKLTILPHKKTVLANGVPATSYRQLFDLYRVLVLSVNDIDLVAGAPEERRLFIDQGILLKDPAYGEQIKTLRRIIKQRGALLARGASLDRATYDVWTDQLEHVSKIIRERRVEYLAALEQSTALLIQTFLGDKAPAIQLTYAPHQEDTVRYEDEVRAKRSLRGAHLDDLVLLWEGKPARRFSSRGQQKLLVTLLKCAQRELLAVPCILFVDDFMTDFDEDKSNTLLALLCKPEHQTIFTSPLFGVLSEKMAAYHPQQILL